MKTRKTPTPIHGHKGRVLWFRFRGGKFRATALRETGIVLVPVTNYSALVEMYGVDRYSQGAIREDSEAQYELFFEESEQGRRERDVASWGVSKGNPPKIWVDIYRDVKRYDKEKTWELRALAHKLNEDWSQWLSLSTPVGQWDHPIEIHPQKLHSRRGQELPRGATGIFNDEDETNYHDHKPNEKSRDAWSAERMAQKSLNFARRYENPRHKALEAFKAYAREGMTAEAKAAFDAYTMLYEDDPPDPLTQEANTEVLDAFQHAQIAAGQSMDDEDRMAALSRYYAQLGKRDVPKELDDIQEKLSTQNATMTQVYELLDYIVGEIRDLKMKDVPGATQSDSEPSVNSERSTYTEDHYSPDGHIVTAYTLSSRKVKESHKMKYHLSCLEEALEGLEDDVDMSWAQSDQITIMKFAIEALSDSLDKGWGDELDDYCKRDGQN